VAVEKEQQWHAEAWQLLGVDTVQVRRDVGSFALDRCIPVGHWRRPAGHQHLSCARLVNARSGLGALVAANHALCAYGRPLHDFGRPLYRTPCQEAVILLSASFGRCE
jgi:hypothetical protein